MKANKQANSSPTGRPTRWPEIKAVLGWWVHSWLHPAGSPQQWEQSIGYEQDTTYNYEGHLDYDNRGQMHNRENGHHEPGDRQHATKVQGTGT